MPRPYKSGLDYFFLDTVLDDKFKLIEAEFGIKGFAVVVKLFQKIYGRFGYYCEWTDEVALLFSKEIDEGVNAVSEIVEASVRRGIFDKRLYRKYSILTSKGIQKRYLEATCRRVKIELKREYLLFTAPIIYEIVGNNAINVNINSINDDRNTQRREEKSIEEYFDISAEEILAADVLLKGGKHYE